jgi:hypothetical protein
MSNPSARQKPPPLAVPLPSDLADLLQKDKIRTLDDVADVTTMMIRAFAQGDIHPARSKEIRQWTELLYTTIAAKSPTQDTSVNFIAQLISMDAPVDRPRTIIETEPALTKELYKSKALPEPPLVLEAEATAVEQPDLLEID